MIMMSNKVLMWPPLYKCYKNVLRLLGMLVPLSYCSTGAEWWRHLTRASETESDVSDEHYLCYHRI